ncbi:MULTISPECIES: tetratricopeptide repeat protein [unclassified Myroides]|uniref:tetratricopeptide repeat protein n=1 Tax=unclassified Myroides TaxID=2642485 RepID=UPI003D2F7B10
MSDTCMNHLERYWKTLTLSSNEKFNQQNYLEALKGYKEAMYRAEVLNNHWELCSQLSIPVIQVYIISCTNLANTYEELQEMELAHSFFKRAIYFLIHLLEHPSVSGETIQGDLKQALLNYADFTSRTQYDSTLAMDVLLQTLAKES